jgi:hypothetical protein
MIMMEPEKRLKISEIMSHPLFDRLSKVQPNISVPNLKKMHSKI